MLSITEDRKLVALLEGQVQPIADCQHLRIGAHAYALVPIVVAGEDSMIHSLAWGPLGGDPTRLWTPEPRDLVSLHEEIHLPLAERVLAAADRAAADEEPLQLWVSGPAAIGVLPGLAHRLMYPPAQLRSQSTGRLGRLLRFFHLRAHHEGQQAFVVCTAALSEHWATGQDDGEDAHLGAELEWHTGPASTIHERVLAAEAIPAGIKTDPQNDRVLADLMGDYNRARRLAERGQASKREVKARAQAIDTHLEPTVTHIWGLVEQAADRLRSAHLPELPALSKLWSKETKEFQRYMNGVVRKDALLPRRDNFNGAMKEYDDREASSSAYEQALLADPMVQAELRLRGELYPAEVADHRVVKAGRSRTTHLRVRVARPHRLRVDDEVGCARRPGLVVRVEVVRRRRHHDELSLIAGRLPDGSSLGTQKVAAEQISKGDRLMLTEAALDKTGLHGARSQATNAVLPWQQERRQDGTTRNRRWLPPSHDPDAQAPRPRRRLKGRPTDLLADAKQIR